MALQKVLLEVLPSQQLRPFGCRSKVRMRLPLVPLLVRRSAQTDALAPPF
jgi:hypothetical protein